MGINKVIEMKVRGKYCWYTCNSLDIFGVLEPRGPRQMPCLPMLKVGPTYILR